MRELYDSCVSYEYNVSSMYPHIIIPFNVAPHTMIGKVISRFIPEDKVNEEKYDAGQDLIDNMLVDNPLNFGTKWLELPDGIELDKMIAGEFNVNKTIIHFENINEKFNITIGGQDE